MTAGLGVGVVCAAFAFTAQTGIHLKPIRGCMPATTFRSSLLRAKEASDLLEKDARLTMVVQVGLQYIYHPKQRMIT